jgi:hypothetical protein
MRQMGMQIESLFGILHTIGCNIELQSWQGPSISLVGTLLF